MKLDFYCGKGVVKQDEVTVDKFIYPTYGRKLTPKIKNQHINKPLNLRLMIINRLLKLAWMIFLMIKST